LITGEKLIVRDTIAEVTDRVLAYRAKLLAITARRLTDLGELEKIIALASLDLSGQPSHAGTSRKE
jgi:hypothetical protein